MHYIGIIIVTIYMYIATNIIIIITYNVIIIIILYYSNKKSYIAAICLSLLVFFLDGHEMESESGGCSLGLQVVDPGVVIISWSVDGSPHWLALKESHGLDVVLCVCVSV